MIIINFAHPLNEDHLRQISDATGKKVDQVLEVDSTVDVQEPLAPQVVNLVNRIGLSQRDWQTLPIIINLPSLSYIAASLISEIHGRCGYFPTILRIRPVKGAIPTRFEVAEIIDLQAMRDAARSRKDAQEL